MSQKSTPTEKTSATVIPPLAPFVGRQNFTTPNTTPAPTSLPTEKPSDQSFSTNDSLTNRELEMLKDHIRMVKGLPVTTPPTRKRISSACEVPRQCPRPTETSRIRAETRKYRLIQRCSDFVKYHTGEYSEFFSGDKPLTPEQERTLFNKAKHLTAEEIVDEKQRAEVDYLKYLASKTQTSKDFRPNRASEFRFKYTRGEPIISDYYEDSYDYHEKPPFFVAHRYKPMPCWKLPPIDKKKETWFLPQNDGDVPLHVIPKEEPKKVKQKERKRKERKRIKRDTQRQRTTISPEELAKMRKAARYRLLAQAVLG